jgi:hypothetical protein
MMRTVLLASGLMAACLGMGASVRADVVTEWNMTACEVSFEARVPTPVATRLVATAAVAVSDAVLAITPRYPPILVKLDPAPAASLEATVAAAARGVLLSMSAGQKAMIEAAYTAALAKIPDGAAKTAGIDLGALASAMVLAARANDGSNTPDTFRPYTVAGRYVPTILPIGTTMMLRTPWATATNQQFRPGPPPDLAGPIWARDYNEIKSLGGKNSTQRTAEQTEIARFWEATNPVVYAPVAYSVANMPGRDAIANARLLAVVAMAADDAMSAIFDAKYTYGFWRPVSAIRNGDIDGNDATERDAGWMPFIDTPMHPEYPCAHCVVSGAYGAVLKAALGSTPSPTLTTTSPTLPGKPRSWANTDDFIHEVALARIYDGVHYRNSTEVGTAMGIKIGELAAARFLPH